MPDNLKKDIKCFFIMNGVSCDREAVRYFRLNKHPYHEAFCSYHIEMSAPRGHSDRKEISYEEAIVENVMED